LSIVERKVVEPGLQFIALVHIGEQVNKM